MVCRRNTLPATAENTADKEALKGMNYQKEYAMLVCQVDRVISILEKFSPEDPMVARASQLLLDALREAEEHYMAAE